MHAAHHALSGPDEFMTSLVTLYERPGAVQNGAVQEFNLFQAQSDTVSVKKSQLKSLPHLTRLRSMGAVTLNQLQQAHAFLDLHPPPKGLVLRRAIPAGEAVALAPANNPGLTTVADIEVVTAQTPSAQDSAAKQPATAPPAKAEVEDEVKSEVEAEARAGMKVGGRADCRASATAVKAEEEGQAGDNQHAALTAADRLNASHVNGKAESNPVMIVQANGAVEAAEALPEEVAAAAALPVDGDMEAEAASVPEASDAALPAYAMQMDGPNDLFSAQPDPHVSDNTAEALGKRLDASSAAPAQTQTDTAEASMSTGPAGSAAAEHHAAVVVPLPGLPALQSTAPAMAPMPAADPAQSTGNLRNNAIPSDTAGSLGTAPADGRCSEHERMRVSGKRMSQEAKPKAAQIKRQKTSAGAQRIRLHRLQIVAHDLL